MTLTRRTRVTRRATVAGATDSASVATGFLVLVGGVGYGVLRMTQGGAGVVSGAMITSISALVGTHILWGKQS